MRPGPPHPDHRGHRVNGMARSAYHSQVPHRRRLSASVAQDQIFPHLVCAPSDLLGDVAQTYLLGAQTPHQRSLFDIEMGGQWISSGWTLHQWGLIERCAHPRHPRIRMGGDRTLPNDASSRTRWRSHDRCATESGNVHIGRHPGACVAAVGIRLEAFGYQIFNGVVPLTIVEDLVGTSRVSSDIGSPPGSSMDETRPVTRSSMSVSRGSPNDRLSRPRRASLTTFSTATGNPVSRRISP